MTDYGSVHLDTDLHHLFVSWSYVKYCFSLSRYIRGSRVLFGPAVGRVFNIR